MIYKNGYLKPRKRCSRCKGLFILNKFSKRINSPDGYQYYCKKCIAKLKNKKYIDAERRMINKIRGI